MAQISHMDHLCATSLLSEIPSSDHNRFRLCVTGLCTRSELCLGEMNRRRSRSRFARDYTEGVYIEASMTPKT